jgi:hypothetical protein
MRLPGIATACPHRDGDADACTPSRRSAPLDMCPPRGRGSLRTRTHPPRSCPCTRRRPRAEERKARRPRGCSARHRAPERNQAQFGDGLSLFRSYVRFTEELAMGWRLPLVGQRHMAAKSRALNPRRRLDRRALKRDRHPSVEVASHCWMCSAPSVRSEVTR